MGAPVSEMALTRIGALMLTQAARRREDWAGRPV